MSTRYFLPGFGLMPAMYKSLDLDDNSVCIETPELDTFDDNITKLNSQFKPNSLVVGYSMGARIALSCALQSQTNISGLVLISFHAGLEPDQQQLRKIEDLELSNIALQDPNEMYKILDSKSVFTTHTQPENQSKLDDIRIKESKTLAHQVNTFGLGSFPYLEDQLITLRIPVLYVTGSRDKKYTELAMRYKKKTAFSHHRVLDSDHRIPLNVPRTLSLVIDWFDSCVVNGPSV